MAVTDEVFDESHAKTMAALLLWAYEHDIDVKFFRRSDYGGSYPVIRFSVGPRHVEHGFWPLCHTDEFARKAWSEIAQKLCVTAPRFL